RADAARAFIPLLRPEDGTPVVKSLLFELYSRLDVNSPGDNLNLEALLRQPRPPAEGRPGAAVAALGLSAAAPLHALPVLASLADPSAGWLPPRAVTDLLRRPLGGGGAGGLLLNPLGTRSRRTFANHWEFVRFGREQHLDLDFTSPPARP